VTAVASTSKLEFVRSLGADDLIDYTREEITSRGKHDLILDIGGNRSLHLLRRALTKRGTLVIVGGEGGGRWLGGTERLLRALLLSPFVSQKLRSFISSENHPDLETLGGLVESGQLIPMVDRVYALAETPQAIRNLQDGQVRGKFVISVGS
jgi:NADPH:quinone reductase-like Zn-dependent oxidoreductase